MASPRFNNMKVWPHLTLVFLGFAALGAVAAALWMRHEPKAEALAIPRAARVERVEGEVGLGRGLNADEDAEGRWVALTPNTPLTEGDRLYARDDARASLAFTGRNRARIDPGSALDVVSLSDRRTQLALREGSAVFDIGQLAPEEVFEVATPYGAVDLQEPGLYEVGYNDDGSAFVSVLSGVAQVIGLAGSGQVSKGEMLTLLGQTAAQVALSRLSPDYAGGLLDDYYGYQYPDAYDGRYRDYDAYLNDPYYYDPYNGAASYRHVPASVPGAYDLDRYGDWQNLGDYGYAWSPRVEPDWAPYREGHWMLDDPYGPTWVSNEPWGYAPYHYGRWVNSDGRWYWVPDGADTQPAYAPALVAFLPQAGSELIGWAPLAPGEAYAPAYYDENWRPHYFGGEPALPERLVNLNTPGALTVVPVGDFYDIVERDRVARYDPRSFEGVRPARDPLSHAVLRQLSLTHAAERRGFALPPGLAKKLEERQVYASAPPPRARPFSEDLSRRLGVAALPEKPKKEKLQFRDERAQRQQGKAEERDARRSDARRERREQFDARRGQRRQEFPQAESVTARGEERARGERGGGQTRREQRELERQQQRAAAEQQRSSMRQQPEERRQGRQHAAAQRAQQHAAARSQQQEMRSRQSQPRGRGAERQQQQRPAAQASQGHGRGGGQRHAEKQQKGGGRPSGGPPQGKQQGGGGGKGGGKGKGKH